MLLRLFIVLGAMTFIACGGMAAHHYWAFHQNRSVIDDMVEYLEKQDAKRERCMAFAKQQGFSDQHCWASAGSSEYNRRTSEMLMVVERRNSAFRWGYAALASVVAWAVLFFLTRWIIRGRKPQSD